MKDTEHVDYLINKLIHCGLNLNEKLALDILSVKDQALAPLIHIVKSNVIGLVKMKTKVLRL